MKWLLSLLLPLIVFSSNLLSGEQYIRYEEILKFRQIYEEGKSFFTSGEYSEAITYFLELLKNEKKLPPKALKYVKYYTAESYFQLGLYQPALKNFLWLKNHPPIPYKERVLKRVMELFYLLDKYDDFTKNFSEILNETAQNHDEFSYLYGRILLEEKNFPLAVTYLSRVAPESSWFGKSQYFLGYAYAGERKYGKAFTAWQKIQKIFPQKDVIYMNMGIISRKLGKLDQAYSYFSKITAGSPQRETALYYTAWIYIDENKLSKALDTLKQLALEFPQSKRLGNVSLLIGYIYLAMDRFKDAYLYFQANLEIFKHLEQQMRLFRETQGLPEEFYLALKMPTPESVTLPTIVKKWVLNSSDVKIANNYIEDIKEIKLQIDDLKYSIHELALDALSPENERKSPAYMDLLTLNDIKKKLIFLTGQLLTLKEKPIDPYLYNEERLIISRIRLVRENLLDFQNMPLHILEKISEKKDEIEALRNYILKLDPDVLQQKKNEIIHGNLKIEIPNAKIVLEKFYQEIDALTRMSLDLFSLRYWIKEAIDYTFQLENRMLDIVLYRLGIYGDQRYPFFIQVSDIFQDSWGVMHTITEIQYRIAMVERKNFMNFYANAVSEEQTLNTYLAELDFLNNNFERVRGGLAMEDFDRIKSLVHDYNVSIKLGEINVAWKAKEHDEKLSNQLLNEKERLKEKILKHYQWVVKPTKEPPPREMVQKDLDDYIKLLSKAEQTEGNKIYLERLKKLGDLVAQLIGQYYRVKEVIERMGKPPLQ